MNDHLSHLPLHRVGDLLPALPVRSGRWLAALAAGAMLVAFAVVAGPGALRVMPTVENPLSRPAAAGGRALELVDLSDIASGAAFTVSGHLHNPVDAPRRIQVSAVVLLEDAAGRTIGSGRSTVAEQLAPGATASFVVMLEATRPAAHYRVSFRERDRMLPHIDLRAGEKAMDSRAGTPVEHVGKVEKRS